MDLYTLDEAGTPVRCADWITWAACASKEFRLARTEVGDGYVSTIFLGWHDPKGRRKADPPLLFETMTIGVDGLDGVEERYATRAAALAGHWRAVATARAAVAEAEPPPAA